MYSISKNFFRYACICFLIIFNIFATELKKQKQMRVAITNQSILILKHKGAINQFFGGVNNKTKDNSIHESTLIEKQQKNGDINTENENVSKKKINGYRLNKKKIRQKALSFANLDASKKFIGFYSISFPLNTNDTIARQILNVFLTKLREKYNLSNYMWVAERQKNKTIHFHLLTNNKMPINEVNSDMAKILDYYNKKGLISWGNSSFNKYNGVDLSYAGKKSKFETQRKPQKQSNYTKNIKYIARYLTKYITKNDQIWDFLPQHYSRSISALCTGYCLSDAECLAFETEEMQKIDVHKVINLEMCDVIFLREGIPQNYLIPLIEHNNRLFNNYS